MKTFLLGIGGGFIGTFIALGSIILFVNIRYFLFASHFCPQCGSTKFSMEYVDVWSKIAHCHKCNAKFWTPTDDYRRSWPREKGTKDYSMRLSNDWKECIAVIFRWNIKRLKERFPRVPNLKVSENKS
jgi:ribosomal protein L37AE/L43A